MQHYLNTILDNSRYITKLNNTKALFFQAIVYIESRGSTTVVRACAKNILTGLPVSCAARYGGCFMPLRSAPTLSNVLMRLLNE